VSESRKIKREPDKPTTPTAASAEITLELLARTAIELHKLSPNEAAIHGDVMANRGQQAIELLSIWARQLEIERITGAAAKNAEELLSRCRAEEQEDAKRREELKRQAKQQVEWSRILKTRPIAFEQAAKMIFPKKKRSDRIEWLERVLKTLADEKSPRLKTLVPICRNALRNRSIPEGLIPHLKAHAEVALKTDRSRTARESGQKGGIKRAQKYQINKTAGENDASEINSSDKN
jgi:hypothetical protein